MITEAYRIVRIRNTPTLLCLLCDSFSTYIEDVMQRHCLHCGTFLDEIPENYRRPPRTVRNIPGWHAPPANDPNNHLPPEGA